MTDVHRVIGSLQQRGVVLQLDTTDLCFLIALRVKAHQSALSSFEEEHLYDVFEQVCEFTEPGASSLRKRATHTIDRLRAQRLLGRVDGAGLVQSGEYALSRLALAVVDFFLEDEALTRESLAVLTKTLSSQLVQIKHDASSAGSAEEWSRTVVEPLRVTVGDLVAGIERRQRGLDAQQEEVCERIGELLQADWFGAVDGCDRLLEETSLTLTELNEVLLQDSGFLQQLLAEIEELASQGQAGEAEQACQKVAEQVDRVVAWGGARLRAWSEYYQFVQRYLRSVVRLDPDRAVSQRLRDHLAGWPERPYGLVAARTPPMRILRDPDTRPVRPAVTRPRAEREEAVEEAMVEREPLALAVQVEAALERSDTLSGVLRAVLPSLPARDRYRATG